MKTSSKKAKGRRLQQWVCQKISDLTGFETGKDKPIETRPMGQSGTDVRMEQSVKKLFPFSVECKNQERWDLHSWIKQAESNKESGSDWLLVIKRNHNNPIVVLDANVFFKMLEGGNNG